MQVFVKDLKFNNELNEIDFLNICIPQINDFESVVIKNAIESNAKNVIIHSTVKVGTTEKISKFLDIPVVHSPVRGLHPNLVEGLLTFVKFIGSENIEYSKKIKDHLKCLGIKTKILANSKTTELGKLLDTTYYGVCIAWHAEMKKMCDHENLSFDEVVSNFNETYNDGYKKLGKENVIRPVLYPPTNNIGGHCVIQNAKLLKENYLSEALDLILKYQ